MQNLARATSHLVQIQNDGHVRNLINALPQKVRLSSTPTRDADETGASARAQSRNGAHLSLGSRS